MSGPELCPKCKGLHYKNAPCIVRATKSPVRISHKEKPETSPTTAKSDIPVSPPLHVEVHTQPKRRVGRPRSITDMRAYKARKQREYRAKLKAQKEMGK